MTLNWMYYIVVAVSSEACWKACCVLAQRRLPEFVCTAIAKQLLTD